MRDRLENFITDHRDQFDDKVPNLKVWCRHRKAIRSTKG